MPLSASSHLGPYEIIAPLGVGGMGEVYRALDTKLDRQVAVKVLPERLADDPQALARFEREAKALAALSHPNILAIHDFGRDQGVTYAVSELLEGETLRQRLARRAIKSWREAVEIAAAVAEGLRRALEGNRPSGREAGQHLSHSGWTGEDSRLRSSSLEVCGSAR
jgi:eukaryotic-like serine/threonine-protein kinase